MLTSEFLLPSQYLLISGLVFVLCSVFFFYFPSNFFYACPVPLFALNGSPAWLLEETNVDLQQIVVVDLKALSESLKLTRHLATLLCK